MGGMETRFGPLTTLEPRAVAERLEAVRERTLSLIAGLDWETLRRQHIPILSPMVWDLGHIGFFEEDWLVGRLGTLEPIESDFKQMFDATLNPRPTREKLPLPTGRELFEYLGRVRRRTLRIMGSPEAQGEPELVADGFVYEMVAEHEEQHQETILQLLQTLSDPAYVPAQRRQLPPGSPLEPEMIEIPGGPSLMGWSGRGFSYDNEEEQHEVAVPTFLIDRTPVTCGEYLTFVEEGGYDRRDLWSDEGWQWKLETGAEAPGNWSKRDAKWEVKFMEQVVPLPKRKPVVHVCFYEADAYARSAGNRLPTEAEWEKAALWDEAAGIQRAFPWGDEPPSQERANLDQLAFEPADVGAYPLGVSAYGLHQMTGDVWEWTSSFFGAYPGFEAFPYREYSEIFFGSDYRVLRGGSWATRPAVARGTFRNWDYPIRRQIFAGFRCASDA
jgi:iron(II)-dependent oxidoreductase